VVGTLIVLGHDRNLNLVDTQPRSVWQGTLAVGALQEGALSKVERHVWGLLVAEPIRVVLAEGD